MSQRGTPVSRRVTTHNTLPRTGKHETMKPRPRMSLSMRDETYADMAHLRGCVEALSIVTQDTTPRVLSEAE